MSSNVASLLNASASKEKHNVTEVASMHSSNDLESRLRGMILSNAKPPSLPPHMQAASHSAQEEYRRKQPTDVPSPTPPKTNTLSQKPNQAQRKQLRPQSNQELLPAPTQQSLPQTLTPWQRSQRVSENVTSRPPQQVKGQKPVYKVPNTHQDLHPSSMDNTRTPRGWGFDTSRPRYPQARGSPAYNGSPHSQSNAVLFHPSMAPNARIHGSNLSAQPNNGAFVQGHPVRPVPQSRQLFDPSIGGSHYNFRPQTLRRPARSLRAQVMFLEELAMTEIRKAEIGLEELESKEALRTILEQMSRQIVSAYEKSKQDQFDEGSVALKCYGSLSSGFATQFSDMDLAFISPNSVPSTTSTASEIPRLLEDTFLKAGYGARLLTRTRVPILKFCEKPTPDLLEALRKNREKWEKSKDQSMNCYNCGEEGHLSHSCTAPKKPKPCFRCGESGHVAKQCNNLVLPGGVILPAQKSDEADKSNQIKTTQELKTSHGTVVDGKAKNPIESIEQSSISATAETQSKSIPEDASNLPETNGHDSSTLGESSEAIEQTDVPESDEELVHLYHVAMDDGCYDEAERGIIREYIGAVQQYGPNGGTEVSDARLHLGCFPDRLQRYRDRLKLDFPKVGVGIHCDINFSNQLGLHNTLMLRCYSHCDPRVRLMVLFVKSWAQRRKINSPYHGTLSSYGYVLMVLHYCVNVAKPPVTPNLQLCRKAFQAGPGSEANNTLIDGYNVRFWRSESEIRECAAANQLTVNEELLGSLLRGFFEYFAMPVGGGFSWSSDVLSLRTPGGILSKPEKGWTAAKTTVVESNSPSQPPKEIRQRYLFAIEDPFELDHNIARTVVHHGIIAIREEFRRANTIIQGWQEGDLFAEIQDRGNLQKTAPRIVKQVDEKINGGARTGEKEAQAAEAAKGPVISNRSPPRRHVPALDQVSTKSKSVPKQPNAMMPKPKNQQQPVGKKDKSLTSNSKTTKLPVDQKLFGASSGIASDVATKDVEGFTPALVRPIATASGEEFKSDTPTSNTAFRMFVEQPNQPSQQLSNAAPSAVETERPQGEGERKGRNGEAHGGRRQGQGRGRGRGSRQGFERGRG